MASTLVGTELLICCLAYILAQSDARSFRQLEMHKNMNHDCDSVPPRLVFNYKENLLDPSEPLFGSRRLLADNVARSIRVFQRVDEVEFGDDSQCRTWIEDAHSKQLAEFFVQERDGRYKSDLCRLAQLYLRGGIYLDNDIEPLADFRPELPECTSLVSVASAEGGIFQAFLAASDHHPAIKLAMDLTLQYYLDTLEGLPRGPVGTAIMELALREYTGHASMSAGDASRGVVLFQEKMPEPGRFRRVSAIDVCNHGVWYGQKQLFFSRATGHWTGDACQHTERWSYVLPRFLRTLGEGMDVLSLVWRTGHWM